MSQWHVACCVSRVDDMFYRVNKSAKWQVVGHWAGLGVGKGWRGRGKEGEGGFGEEVHKDQVTN